MISDIPIAGYALLTKRDKAINAALLQFIQSTNRSLDRHNRSVILKGHEGVSCFNEELVT